MINTSLERISKEVISSSRAICTLEMSRKMFPGSKNNLNALCRRFNISLESREKHGALTDCFLLQEVYIELLGGKQEKLNLSQSQSSVTERFKIPKSFEAVSVSCLMRRKSYETLRRSMGLYGINFHRLRLN